MAYPYCKVGIFWDYENIEVPSEVSVSRVVGDLCNLGKSYGALCTVKCYMDTDLLRSEKGKRLRGELQANAVTISDTPHRNRKEVADVMMMTDALVFGLETPQSVVILVTADEGFAYPVSILNQRSCKVVLVTTEALVAKGDRGALTTERKISFRSELLKLPPKQKHQHQQHHQQQQQQQQRPPPPFYPYYTNAMSSTSRPIASNSRALDRFSYEEFRFNAGSRMPPSLSSSTFQATYNTRSNSATEAGEKGKGKAKAVAAVRSLGTMTLSDDAGGGSDSDLEIQSETRSNWSLSPPRFRATVTRPNVAPVPVHSSSTSRPLPSGLPPRPPASYSTALKLPPPPVFQNSRSSASVATKPRDRNPQPMNDKERELLTPAPMSQPRILLHNAQSLPQKPSTSSKKRKLAEEPEGEGAGTEQPKESKSKRRRRKKREAAFALGTLNDAGQQKEKEEENGTNRGVVIVLSDDEPSSL